MSARSEGVEPIIEFCRSPDFSADALLAHARWAAAGAHEEEPRH